ncbi:hypothetical protein [Paenibacillus mesotrionivorans]|uniref:Uncharacterized protein n=1 Tax=Paenibacillus mesotrionivorans TaxID=3160968 RepID=A0ACC7P5H1_9BACL
MSFIPIVLGSPGPTVQLAATVVTDFDQPDTLFRFLIPLKVSTCFPGAGSLHMEWELSRDGDVVAQQISPVDVHAPVGKVQLLNESIDFIDHIEAGTHIYKVKAKIISFRNIAAHPLVGNPQVSIEDIPVAEPVALDGAGRLTDVTGPTGPSGPPGPKGSSYHPIRAAEKLTYHVEPSVKVPAYDGTIRWTTVQTHPPLPGWPGQTVFQEVLIGIQFEGGPERRFEVQYRIVDQSTNEVLNSGSLNCGWGIGDNQYMMMMNWVDSVTEPSYGAYAFQVRSTTAAFTVQHWSFRATVLEEMA